MDVDLDFDGDAPPVDEMDDVDHVKFVLSQLVGCPSDSKARFCAMMQESELLQQASIRLKVAAYQLVEPYSDGMFDIEDEDELDELDDYEGGF